MFKRKKKGQLTVFILISIVLVVIFSILFSIYTNAQQTKDDEQRELQYSNLIQNSLIKNSIDICFDTQIVKGLELLGKQGGFIYGSQGGSVDINNIYYLNYSGFNVNYGIRRREPGSKFYIKPIPEYPYTGKLDKKDFPYFGMINFTGLCKPLGANSDCTSKSVYNSFEEQLEIYIENGTRQCLESTLIHESFENYNITTGGDPELKVEFGKANVIFNLNYNISFVFVDRIVNGVEDFKVVKNIRLKQLYNFIRDMMSNEITDIKFDIDNDFGKLRSMKSGFKVSRNRQPCTKCSAPKKYDDIIKVMDSESLLEGNPYAFFIARENRIPALELITQKGLELSTEYNFKLKEGDEMVVMPVAYDPDEETSFEFNYSGWQETQLEFFDFNDPNYDDKSPDESISITKYNNENDQPKEWTKSKLYVDDYPNANYSVTMNDVGHHVLKVGVKDRQGLYDYQDVKVFVQDKPRFGLRGEHDHDDHYKPYYASIEDTYTLYSTVQCIFCESKEQFSKTKLNYRFSKFGENNPYAKIETEKKELKLNKDMNDPFKIDPDNPNLKTPFLYKQDQVSLFLPEVTNYETNYKDLEVFQCWPIENVRSAPYPYNNVRFDDLGFSGIESVDDFKANHACCEPVESGKGIGKAHLEGWKGGKFKENTEPEPCLDILYNTCNPGFLKQDLEDGPLDYFHSRALFDDGTGKLEEYDKDVLDDMIQITAAVTAENSWNNVYKRTFKQQCSGNRGNACAGEIIEEFELVKDCRDKNEDDAGIAQPRGEDESCMGPGRNLNKGNCFNHQAACQAYDIGETFETVFLDWDNTDKAGVNGFCNDNFAYADAQGSGKYAYNQLSDIDHPFKCKAKCDDGSAQGANRGECTYADECECGLGNVCNELTYDEVFFSIGKCIDNADDPNYGVFCSAKCAVLDVSVYARACQCAQLADPTLSCSGATQGYYGG